MDLNVFGKDKEKPKEMTMEEKKKALRGVKDSFRDLKETCKKLPGGRGVLCYDVAKEAENEFEKRMHRTRGLRI